MRPEDKPRAIIYFLRPGFGDPASLTRDKLKNAVVPETELSSGLLDMATKFINSLKLGPTRLQQAENCLRSLRVTSNNCRWNNSRGSAC